MRGILKEAIQSDRKGRPYPTTMCSTGPDRVRAGLAPALVINQSVQGMGPALVINHKCREEGGSLCNSTNPHPTLPTFVRPYAPRNCQRQCANECATCCSITSPSLCAAPCCHPARAPTPC